MPPWMTAMMTLITSAKNAGPVFADLVQVAEQVGADVSAHKSVAQDFMDALTGLEKSLKDATGI